MRYYPLLLLSLLSVSAESAYLRHGKDGGLEFEVDLLELPRHLTSSGSSINVNDQFGITSAIGREYEYEEGSDASLLNQLIAFFLPHVNSVFQSIVPDPLPIPIKGSFNLPEIDLFGYCKANAGFNVSLGTMVGLSGLAIDRIQVLTGTERIRAGWNLDEGCLETIFTAFFDMEVSSPNSFSVNDMYGGIHGSVCSYSIDEKVAGGIETLFPRMRGAVNITGSLVGTKATIHFADLGNAFKVGYERIEAYIDNAPQALNDAVRNITSELSVLAKEQILNFIMNDELMKTVEPTVHSRAQRSLIGRSVQLKTDQALGLNAAFMKNRMGHQVETAVESSLNFLQKLGFQWT